LFEVGWAFLSNWRAQALEANKHGFHSKKKKTSMGSQACGTGFSQVPANEARAFGFWTCGLPFACKATSVMANGFIIVL
jgi:hypothetical protein